MPSIELLKSTHSNAFNQTKNTFFLLLGEKLLKNKRKKPPKEIEGQSYIRKFTNELRIKLSTKYLLI